MVRLVALLAMCVLSGCSGVGRGTVEADVVRLYPGCQLKDFNSTRNLNGDDKLVLAKFTYTCPGDGHLKYGNLVYTKSMDTGFTIYCCARDATAAEL